MTWHEPDTQTRIATPISNIDNNNNNNNNNCSSKHFFLEEKKMSATFILFDKEAEKLLQTIARELSNKCAIVRPYN